MKLAADTARVANEQRLGLVATGTPDGRPTPSPTGTTAVLDGEHLAFAGTTSPGTVTGPPVKPYVEVNVVDPIARAGCRFTGVATVLDAGDADCERATGVLRARESTTERAQIRAIAITDGAPLVSPAYDAGATQGEVVARWLQHTELHGTA